MYVRMEYSDEEDFNLTQQPVRDYCDTQSAQYGSNITEGEDVVSLEANGDANFDIGLHMFSQREQEGYEGDVGIEQISSDEEVDLM